MANITIFPVGKSLPTLKHRICDGSVNLHILAVVSKSSQVRIFRDAHIIFGNVVFAVNKWFYTVYESVCLSNYCNM